MDDHDPIHNLAEGGGGGQDEAPPPPPPPPPILLTPEAQLLFSILNSHQSSMEELPHYVNGTIIEAVNDIAEEFVAKVKKSVVDILFVSKNDGLNRQERERGLTSKTIVGKDWITQKGEKQLEKAIRFFPDVVVEKRYGFYPIQWMTVRDSDTNTFNLMSVSLLPLILKLAIEFRPFCEELRGGLLSLYPSGRNNTLQQIICYSTKNSEDNELLDACFSVVRNWMRENNYLVNEDIQRYNLVGKLFTTEGALSESRLRYLIDIDPVTLSLPCYPERGNWLPTHWSAQQKDIRLFSMVLKTGIQHYPKEFGFVFREGTCRDDNGNLYKGTPFQLACDKYGQEKVRKLVMDRIQEYICSFSTTLTSAAATNRETSLLLSAITDKTIHRDALYTLLRKDPTAALSKIQQQVLLLDGVGDGQSGTTNTITNSNDNNSNNGATDTIAAATVSTSVTMMTAPTTTI